MFDSTRSLRSPLALLQTLVLALAVLCAAQARAALDGDAHTDDHNVNRPTDWWAYANLTPGLLASRLQQHDARIAGLEVSAVSSDGLPRFTARLVPNSGAYAVPGWWWYYDQTAEQLTALLNANSGRLIELERYDRGGGQIRYAVVMVSNTGVAARGWSYLLGATAAQLATHMVRSNQRPIDLDAHDSGSARRYDAVFVSNTGADRREFDWAADLTTAEVTARVNAWQGRIVKLGRVPGGRYLFVQVRNTASDSSVWWHKYGFGSMAELRQWALQMAARPVDVVSRTTVNGRVFDAALIDNANGTERRLRNAFAPFIDANQNPRGIFSAYLKRVDGNLLVDLNSERRAETASAVKVLHHLHAMRQVRAGADSLDSAFAYYEYPADASGHEPQDRCPDPSYEVAPYQPVMTTLEIGLDQMMGISDNRTTRGVVLRYGGYGALNATADAAGLKGTTIRHDIGCGYYDMVNRRYDPTGRRNETSAADLARIYEGVWNRSLLDSTRRSRQAFLDAVKIDGPLGLAVKAIVTQEATAQGKAAIATDFYNLMRRWGKGGTYGTCLGQPDDMARCGQGVHIHSFAGLVAVPLNGGLELAFRHYAFGALFSDVPYEQTSAGQALVESQVNAFWNDVNPELLREIIRSALLTW